MTDMLLGLQQDFQDYILGQGRRATALVESTPALSAERRLDIYHNAYRARLIELLADTYERVVHYIGDEAFEQAALDYIEAHAPTARNLRHYGMGFPAFLATRFPDDTDVAELADMDLRLRNTFDAPDADTLRATDLAAITPDAWDAVLFRLHPTVSLVCFQWNTPAIWQCLNEARTPPLAERAVDAQAWLFWRKELQPHFRSLTSEEHTSLQLLAEGHSFGAVCEQLAAAFPQLDVAAHIGACLRCWLEDGLLKSFD